MVSKKQTAKKSTAKQLETMSVGTQTVCCCHSDPSPDKTISEKTRTPPKRLFRNKQTPRKSTGGKPPTRILEKQATAPNTPTQ